MKNRKLLIGIIALILSTMLFAATNKSIKAVGTAAIDFITGGSVRLSVSSTGAISGTSFLDEDNMASDSATSFASQQSIKAYADLFEPLLVNSAGVASAVSDESGTGFLLFGTNPTITGADLNFGTATNSIRLLPPQDTTTNLAALTQTEGLVGYDTVLQKLVVNDGTSFVAVGAGGGADNFDYVFTAGQVDDSVIGDWSTGNHADIMGGGVLVGTLAISTVADNKIDVDRNGVLSWTAVGGNETGDYFCSSPTVVPQGLRNNNSNRQDILVKFWYWTEISEPFYPKVYCVGDAVEVTHLSTTPILTPNDYDGDGVKDATEGTEFNDGLGVAYSVPTSCSSVRVCFQQWGDTPSGEELFVDDIKVGVMPVNHVETIQNELTIVEEDMALALPHGATTKITFSSPTIHDAEGRWDTSTNKYLVPETGYYTVSYSAYIASGANHRNVHSKVYIDGVADRRFDSSDSPNVSAASTIPHTGIVKKAWLNKGEEIEFYQYFDTSSGAAGTMDYFSFSVEKSTSNKAIAVTGSQHMAGHFGSVKWESTTNCNWTKSSAAWANFSADADCDDNARTIKGLYNSTNGDVANSDGQLPQIKFSQIPAGVLRCEGRGMFYQNTGEGSWRFHDGTTGTSQGTIFENNNDVSSPTISGEFHYDSPQTDVTINIQTYNTANQGDISLPAAPRELEISCQYFPSDTQIGKGLNYMLPTIDVGGAEEYQVTGDGNEATTSNKVVGFDAGTTNLNTISKTGSVADTAALGWVFTASQRVRVHAGATVRDDSATNMTVAFIINAADGTTTVESLDVATRCYGAGFVRSDATTAASGHLRAGCSAILNAGDTLSLHGQGSFEAHTSNGLRLLAIPDSGPTSYAHIISQPVAFVEDRKVSGTSGGTSSVTEANRTLNTLGGQYAEVGVLLDGTDGFKFTETGTYLIEWFSPFYGSDRAKTSLYNETTSAYLSFGSSIITSNTSGGNTESKGYYLGVINKDDVLALRYEVQTSLFGEGLGVESGSQISMDAAANYYELYTRFKITRKR